MFKMYKYIAARHLWLQVLWPASYFDNVSWPHSLLSTTRGLSLPIYHQRHATESDEIDGHLDVYYFFLSALKDARQLLLVIVNCCIERLGRKID